MENNNINPILKGTHNSMSYLKPAFKGLQWLLYPFVMMIYYIGCRCQSKDIITQFDLGARIFDLRICRKNRNLKEKGVENFNNWIFAHNRTKFNDSISAYDIIKTLSHLAKHYNTKVYIRLILEQCDDDADDMSYFYDFCEHVVNKYGQLGTDNYIEFFGGNRRGNWYKVYNFPTTEHQFTDQNNNQWVSSMADDVRFYEKICPWLYAKRKNKINYSKAKYLTNLYDFYTLN